MTAGGRRAPCVARFYTPALDTRDAAWAGGWALWPQIQSLVRPLQHVDLTSSQLPSLVSLRSALERIEATRASVAADYAALVTLRSMRRWYAPTSGASSTAHTMVPSPRPPDLDARYR